MKPKLTLIVGLLCTVAALHIFAQSVGSPGIGGKRNSYVFSPDGKYLLRAWVHLPGRQLKVIQDKKGESCVSLETYAATTGFDGLIREAVVQPNECAGFIRKLLDKIQ